MRFINGKEGINIKLLKVETETEYKKMLYYGF
jgi:hypothetical protein